MDKLPDVAASSASAPALSGPRAFAETCLTGDIYLDHAPLLRRVAIRKFGVPAADAEALVHDVFINYLAATRTIRGDLRGYLIGAICNACRNYWRSRRSEERLFVEDDPAAADVVSEDIFDGLALNLVVASTLARLGGRCREALKRYYLDGEDTRTIAVALNTSPSNVNYMMYMCRKRAREVYEAITRAR